MSHGGKMLLNQLIIASLLLIGHGYALAQVSPFEQPPSAQHLRMTTSVEGQRLEYLLYRPVKLRVKTPRPLVLFLHGAGERGEELANTLIHGPIQHRNSHRELKQSYMLVPQCPKNGWWQPKTIMALLKSVIAEHQEHIDTDRIYVTGLSMGGYGTWNLISHYPSFFAAAVPVCGGGELESLTIALQIEAPPEFKATNLAKARNVPVWAFHGDKDKAVPHSQSIELTQRLRDAGNLHVKLTVYRGVGHDAWSQTYNNPKLYDWMFRQRRQTSRKVLAPEILGP